MVRGPTHFLFPKGYLGGVITFIVQYLIVVHVSQGDERGVS
jgi:hypothetical protein